MRSASLALRLALKSWPRVALLATLVAVSLVILLVVTELARLSSDDLDQAIASDVGQEGTFSIVVTDVSALDTTRTRDTLTRLAHRFGATEVSVALAYPSLALDCPPFESLGSAPVNVVRDEQGRSWPFDYGNLSDESSLCFQGWTIPGDGLYIPSRNQQARWGTGLYVRPEYEPLLRSATTGEIEMSVSLVVGLAATDKQIEEAARDALRDDLSRTGLAVENVVSVARTDRSGELTSASEGVRVVYRAIGWGVVLLAGVGILVVQLVIVRGRMWLFGLARALGARAGHVVVLVLGESVVAVLLGGLVAAALALTTQPWISRLSQEYFDAPAELWNAQSATTFSVALAGILILSSALPVRRALAADPLDTLEGRS